MEILTLIIGYMAAVFGTALMVPQVYKSFITRRVDDISMVMLIIYLINCCLWGIYGILIKSMPVILCNSMAFIIGLLQTVLKIKFGTKK